MFHRLHKFRADIGEHRLVRIPPDIVDELVAAAITLPLAQTNMRWPISTNVYWTDTTPLSDASVSVGVSRDLASSFFDTSVIRGKSLPVGPSLFQSLEASQICPDDSVIEDVVESLDWEVQDVRHFLGPIMLIFVN